MVRASVAVVLLAGLAACGGSGSGAVNLSVLVTSGFGSSMKDERFMLRCQPTGGDMPNRTRLCAMIASHPRAMVAPAQARSTCLGGPGIPPSVSVSGRWHGRSVRFDARVMCDWPGGVAAFAYWAAADSPHDLPVASVRIHCDDDASLQKTPIRWARVRACLRALPPHWHPSRS
jgi:Subtilisin inhibitor-like